MATIMASVRRVACTLALFAAAGGGRASVDGTALNYSTLPANYTLSYDKDRWTESYSVFHMAVADQFGVVGSGFAASNDPRLRPLTRLDSSWKFNAPFWNEPARLGDGVSSATFWDAPVRVGGIQIGNLQPATPDVVAPPRLIAAPDRATGPFGPTATTTQIIDHLRTLVQFQKETLVASGQSAYSIETGRLRENFEVRSNTYGAWITSGTYRFGLTSATTIDGQFAQVTGQHSVVGLGVLEGLGSFGQFSARVGSSREIDASGWVARMGYDYTRKQLTIALRSHIQSAGFQEVGDTAAIESLRQRTLASARVDLGSLGKISLASAVQTSADDTRKDILALSHAVPFGSGGIVSAAAAYSPGQAGNSALLLSFTYPFHYFAAGAHRTTNAVNSALDRTIVDAFGQLRLPTIGQLPGDKALSLK